jgi:broad specificity phosphatase PhoE
MASDMFSHLPRLVLVPHADAGDRRRWTADQDLRPLSALGRNQAAALAEAVGTVDAIYSSPARRCIETVEAMAARSGIEIRLSDDLREVTFVDEVERWDRWDLDEVWRAQLVASAAIGRAMRVLDTLTTSPASTPERRIVISAHGDLVPMLAMAVAGFFRVPAPHPAARGGAYTVDPTDPTAPIRTIGARAELPPPSQR